MSGLPTPDPNAQQPQVPVQPGFAYPYEHVVAADQLQRVEVPEPQWYAPAGPVRDQRRTTLAAVVTFVALVLALWGILGFLGALSDTLSSIRTGSDRLKVQLGTANEGLASIDEKTSHLDALATDSGALKQRLGGIDGGMGDMLAGIDRIAASMQSMDGSLTTLDSELGKLNDANAQVAGELGTINTGLAGQQRSVAAMAKDIEATGTVLGGLPPRLAASNRRLAHLNSVVNFMGWCGIQQQLKVRIAMGPISPGSAEISATIIPPGAWGSGEGGAIPCRQ